MPIDSETLDSLVLNGLAGLGPAAIRDLIAAYGGASAALSIGVDRWADVVKRPFDAALAAADLSSARGRAEADAELAEKCNVTVCLAHAGAYPPLLRQTACPPPVLYVMGGGIAAEAKAVAIVGSRACTHYGEKMARRLATDLSDAGIVTVSGLARGIDTRVHEASLAAGCPTWAVVGSGLLMTYPPENRKLAERIAQCGAVISEFPMATKPHPSNFPRRNRIIAGLCAATVVVEGGPTSGALITARIAAEEGRDVFAVPGPAMSSQSRAPHRLLRDGALMAETAEDILSELGWRSTVRLDSGEPGAVVDGIARRLLDAVGDVPIDRDELLGLLPLDARSAAPLLVQLEMSGLIKSLPGGKLVRA